MDDDCVSRRQVGGAPTALMAALLARGFMVMASDFSLGALVAQWDAAALGANPFKKVGEFGQQMTLRFDPAVLAACDDSAQPVQKFSAEHNIFSTRIDNYTSTVR